MPWSSQCWAATGSPPPVTTTTTGVVAVTVVVVAAAVRSLDGEGWPGQGGLEGQLG